MHALRACALRVCAVFVLLATSLVPTLALAGRNSMIPPGQELRIRGFVDHAIAAAKAAGELPIELHETVDIHIDRDRVRVVLYARDAPLDARGSELPLFVIFHPDAVPDDLEGALAPGVLVRCGSLAAQRDCEAAEADPWRPLADRLAEARDPFADLIWQVEEVSGPPPEPDDLEVIRQRQGVWVDRLAASFAALLGLCLCGFGIWRARSRGEGPRWPELSLLALMLLWFVGATLHFTPMLPLHEHNTFIARADCAIDPECTRPIGGAWSMTTLHVYGWLLAALPYRAATLTAVSLACSVLGLVLVWALGRTLMRALGRPELSGVAGLVAVGVLAMHPVAWRLAGSETFWAWSIMCGLAAALAGLWGSLAVADEDRRTRIAGSLAWLVAGICLALVCAGNFVLLTLGTCLGLAPACWTPAWRKQASGRAAILRVLVVGLPTVGLFAWMVTTDYVTGYLQASSDTGLHGTVSWLEIRRNLHPLLLDRLVSAPVWIVPMLASLAWLWPMRDPQTGTRDALASVRLVPLLYAWAVPCAFLGIAAGEVVGSGYPVGFINHQWDLWLSALAAGLGTAWIVNRLEQWRPLSQLLGGRLSSRAATWSRVLPAVLVLLAGVWGPRVEEAWRMATEERVLGRELVALEAAFEQLPEHDLLIIPPQVLAPTTDAPTHWDPLEVLFPKGFYAYAMRSRGLEPAKIIELDKLSEHPPPPPNARILFYLGSTLRSFQPHEIEAKTVPDDLERPDVRAVHDAWRFEPAHEFVIRTEQHPEISQRLGADRVYELGLGFYWLRPR